MSKVLKVVGTVAAIAAAVVTAIPSGGTSLAATAGLLGMSLGTTLAVAATVASVGSALLAKKPKAPPPAREQINRLNVSIDPRTPRKMVLGETAMATDIRDEEHAEGQRIIHRFIVTASHEVESHDEVWFDDELAWTRAGGAQGRFANWLEITPIELGSAANAINISARMGSTRRYTGLAYLHIKYTRGEMQDGQLAAKGPFGQSIPNRVTIRGKGAKVYDPRLDSTVPGGSGSHRADDQSTWTWSASGARNPALQLLWYILGWREANSGLLLVGKGVPPARIDLESFAVAANICDEAVSLAAGGTEPRYRSDGVFSEGESPTTILDNLKASMNAILDDVGGKIRLQVLANDLGAPIASFTADDILSGVTWEPELPLDASYNVVRGIFTDPSNTSLYQPVDYPQRETTSDDGIERVDNFDLPLVQSVTQAQRLAQLRLNRALYGSGTLEATFQATAWRVQKGDVVSLTFAPLGFTNKLFRVADYEAGVDGRVNMKLREEAAAIYAWTTADEGAPLSLVPSTPLDPEIDPRYGIGDIPGNLDNIPDGTNYVRYQPTERIKLTGVAPGADVTGDNISAGFLNQGGLATKNAAAWGLDITGRPAFTTDLSSGAVKAEYIREPISGSLLSNRWAAEGGANITETRTAAAIAGQGSLATKNAAAWGSDVTGRPAFSTDIQNVAGTDRIKATYVYDQLLGGTFYGKLPQEGNANVTETRTAAAITGQGALATRSNVYFGSAFILESNGGAQATTAAFKTSLGVASAISGQGALATKSSANLDTDIIDGTAFKRLPTDQKEKLFRLNEYELFEDFARFTSGAELQDWFDFYGSSPPANVELMFHNGSAGGVAMKCGNNSGDDTVNGAFGEWLPFDGDALYEVGIEVQVAENAGLASLYAGVQCKDYNGVLLGSSTANGFNYCIASNKPYTDLYPTYSFKTLVTYIKGYTSALQQSTVGTPNAPVGLPDGTANGTNLKTIWFRPMALLNYYQKAAQIRVHRVWVRKIHTPTAGLVLPGGAVQIGGPRNLRPINAANEGNYIYTGAVTYTTTTTLATVSVAAGNLKMGDDIVAYNAMSVDVPGTAGSTKTVALTIDDPTFAGGSKTLGYTESAETAVSGTGRIIIGSVTINFPSSGTGGGTGGGGGYCTAHGQYVLTPDGPHCLGHDTPEGLPIWGRDDAGAWAFYPIEKIEHASARCVALATENGGRKVVSFDTPTPTRDGYQIAENVGGLEIETLPDGAPAWSRASVEPAGVQTVAKISIGNRCYIGASDPAGPWIVTHNAKPGT